MGPPSAVREMSRVIRRARRRAAPPREDTTSLMLIVHCNLYIYTYTLMSHVTDDSLILYIDYVDELNKSDAGAYTANTAMLLRAGLQRYCTLCSQVNIRGSYTVLVTCITTRLIKGILEFQLF